MSTESLFFTFLFARLEAQLAARNDTPCWGALAVSVFVAPTRPGDPAGQGTRARSGTSCPSVLEMFWILSCVLKICVCWFWLDSKSTNKQMCSRRVFASRLYFSYSWNRNQCAQQNCSDKLSTGSHSQVTRQFHHRSPHRKKRTKKEITLLKKAMSSKKSFGSSSEGW